MKFLTELGHSFRDDGYFAYKIPDMPGQFLRFNPSKPFDMIVLGLDLAIEGKALHQFESFGMRQIRPSQVEGLDAVEKAKGKAYIFLNIRISPSRENGIKRENRCLWWKWGKFKEICKDKSISKNELMGIAYISGAKNRFDLSSFYREIYGK